VLLLYPGGGVGLLPQKATTWELGMDFKPTFLAGFTSSVTYYNIVFKDRIGTAQFYNPNFYALYPSSYTQNTPAAPLTSAQIAQFVSVATPSSLQAANAAYYIAHPELVYSLDSALNQNLSATETKGLDFNVNYNYATSFGSVFGGFGGTYVLSFNSQSTPTSPFEGLSLNNVPRLRMQANVGAKVGEFLARATWKYTDSYAELPNVADAEQSRVASFSTIDLALQYAPQATGLLNHLLVTLNVDNVADTRPPAYNGTNGAGYGYSGFTLGRFIELGIDKKF
jgi:iron complex outermembrane receptor protein